MLMQIYESHVEEETSQIDVLCDADDESDLMRLGIRVRNGSLSLPTSYDFILTLVISKC